MQRILSASLALFATICCFNISNCALAQYSNRGPVANQGHRINHGPQQNHGPMNRGPHINQNVALNQGPPPMQTYDQGMALPNHSDLLRRIENLECRVQQDSRGVINNRYYAQFDTVFVQPVFSNNSAYFGQPDIPGQVADDAAVNVTFDYNYEWSPRVEIGRLCSTRSLGWRARYWHFDASGAAGNHTAVFGVDPDDDAFAINVGAQIRDIDTFADGFILHTLQTDVGDFELTKQHRNAVFGLGFRGARIEQSFELMGTTDEGDVLDAEMSTTGYGPTVSAQLRHVICGTRASVYCDLRGSALFGERSIYADSDGDVGPFFYDADSMMWNSEIQAGFEWQNNPGCRGFFGRLGVEAQYWANVGNLMNTNSSGGDGGSAHGGLFFGDIGFIGINGTIGIDF